MAWAPVYATVSDLKAALGITDTESDAELMYALTASSRLMDQHTSRQFGLVEVAAARYYRPQWDRRRGRWYVAIDDLMTTDDLVVKTDDGSGAFATTLALDSDYRLYPWNAAADERPWTSLAVDAGVTFTQGGTGSFADRALEVTGLWGWTTTPTTVIQACLLQAGRLFKRKDAPFGVAGSPEIGSEIRLLAQIDPDVAVLLDPFRRNWGVA
jgi:hypothetical protein